jgi:hypothetical protein
VRSTPHGARERAPLTIMSKFNLSCKKSARIERRR